MNRECDEKSRLEINETFREKEREEEERQAYCEKKTNFLIIFTKSDISWHSLGLNINA